MTYARTLVLTALLTAFAPSFALADTITLPANTVITLPANTIITLPTSTTAQTPTSTQPPQPSLQPAFYVAPNGSDSNAGTFAAPFATLTKAQAAMRASSTIKTTYIRAGTYRPTGVDAVGDQKALKLESADASETWSYYPPDGVGNTNIDGGATSATTGIAYGFFIHGASGVTVNGLHLHHFTKEAIHAGWDTPDTATPGVTITNNVVHDNFVSGYSSLIDVFGNAKNATVSNNYAYNAGNHGITLQASGGTAISHGVDGGKIINNVIIGVCKQQADCGGIYLQDWAGLTDPTQRSQNVLIQNNLVNDVGISSNAGARGIYLDDGVSNTTVSNNALLGRAWVCVQIHGGQNNNFTNNVCDLGTSGSQGIVLYQSTQASWVIPMTNNKWTANTIVAKSSSGGQGYLNYNSPNSPLVISTNDYWNYVSPNSNIVGGGSSPTFVDPQLSAASLLTGRGPSGYSISLTGTTPSFGP